jgi:O-antigen/teichoic acid export membrane protein
MAKEALTYGIGVLPHHLAAAAAPFISKTLLLNMGSLVALGMYSIALRFFIPLELLYTATNTAFIPIYNGHRKAGEVEKIKQSVRQILIISFIAFAFFQIFGPWMMRWMLPDRFYDSISLIPILSIAFIGKTIYGICVAEIFYSKKTRFVSIITIGGLVVNFLICFLFVKDLGSIAIAWAFSIGFLFWALLAFFYKMRISNFDSFSKEIGIYLFASIIVSIFSFLLT